VASAILWFRRDLRLDDLPALVAAASVGADGVVPLFVVDPSVLNPAGPNRRRFLADALRALDRELGGLLVLRQGDPRLVVPALATEVGAKTVAITSDFGPYGTARDRAVEEALSAAGGSLVTVDSPYVVAPGTVRSSSGAPLRVFTPFHRAWEAVGWERPLPAPEVRFVGAPSDTTVNDMETSVAVPSHSGLPAWWEGLPLGVAEHLPPAGSSAARNRLERFVAGPLSSYAEDRDRPGVAGTSGLSPYLRFGCIHPRTVLMQLGTGAGADRMRAELAWREFYADVLWHRPESARQPLQAFGAHLLWDVDGRSRRRFHDWALGQTGYPLVDAGMRQLLTDGWMHNRVRMITASFLIKDLHIDWRLGARWFMWHLVDGDLASNQQGWQWVAGTGTDAAPFHRVFNPIVQQERFDPDGAYVRRYLGEPSPVRQRDGDLSAAHSGYPEPIVNHLVERREALARFDVAREVATAKKAPQNDGH
jgi:deoxyribodipyrimidine photo-lyase